MTITPILQLPSKPPVKKGVPTEELCKVCRTPMRVGQLFSGVLPSYSEPFNVETQFTPPAYVEGHYLCVIKALGPEETLLAVQQGRLPAIDPRILIDGCLPFEHGGVV